MKQYLNNDNVSVKHAMLPKKCILLCGVKMGFREDIFSSCLSQVPTEDVVRSKIRP